MQRYDLGLHKMWETTLKGEREMMERYTSRNEKGELLLNGNEVFGSNQYNAIEQLENYEDTELLPDEITAFQEENATLTKALELACYELQCLAYYSAKAGDEGTCEYYIQQAQEAQDGK
jgi:hypothetical protein